jgi:hypothetical protein
LRRHTRRASGGRLRRDRWRRTFSFEPCELVAERRDPFILPREQRLEILDAPAQPAGDDPRDDWQNKGNREEREYERDSPFHAKLA